MRTKRKIILIFLLLLIVSWFTALSEAVNNPVKAEEHLEKAAELEEKGIYVDAVTEYENALKYRPDETEIYLKMANAYLNSGNSKKFISICQDAAENDQADTEAMDMLMEYYLENHYEDKAVKYLAGFIEEYPDNENAQQWFAELKGSYTELYCRYDELSEIVDHSMTVKDDELYGLADANGNELIAAEYKEIHPFSGEGFALAQKEDGSYIYIDEDGQTRKVPDKDYEDLGMYDSGRASACLNGKYGYLDEDMEPVGEFVWDDLTGIKNNVGAGAQNGKWVLIDKNGKVKQESSYDDVIVDENGFCSGQKRIFVKENGSFHMINTKGKAVGELTFEDAKAFTEDGCAAVCSDGKWGFVDTDGELVIDFIYEEAESFQNGFAAVRTDGVWGYIDEEGNLAVEPEFTVATHISAEGTAAVKTQEEWKLIQLNIFR